MTTRQQEMIERREAEISPTLNVGTIAVSTWGYDQTNVDFYRVEERKVRKDGSTWIKVQRIHAAQTPAELFMQYTATPFRHAVTGEYSTAGEPKWRKVHQSSAFGESFEPSSYSFACPWDGQPVWGSSYA